VSGSLRLGAWSGVSVVADASAMVLGSLFAFSALVDLSSTGSSVGSVEIGIAALAAGLAALISVGVHEVSHAIVARRRGLDVREIRLNMFGGYSVIGGEPSLRDELMVAVAGPLASLVLGMVFALVGVVSRNVLLIGDTIWALAIINVAIGLFNLMPGFPLDGARILRSGLTTQSRGRVAATRIVTSIGRAFGWLIVIVGVWMLVARQSLGLLVIVAGWFLAQSAVASGRREEFSALCGGLSVADVMRSTPEAVSGDLLVSTLVGLYSSAPSLRSLPVRSGGRVVGVIGQIEIDEVTPSRWPFVHVISAMAPIGPVDVVEASEMLETFLLRPAATRGRGVVVSGGKVVGILDDVDRLDHPT